ncbi:MAG: hypothetical protein AAFR78_06465, partial [Planctomycetota bacterium]
RDLTPNLGSQPVVVRTSFPARYTIEIYTPPGESSVMPFFGSEDVQAAVGDVVLFEDVDSDGIWDQD